MTIQVVFLDVCGELQSVTAAAVIGVKVSGFLRVQISDCRVALIVVKVSGFWTEQISDCRVALIVVKVSKFLDRANQ
jgi:hypothetical protein